MLQVNCMFACSIKHTENTRRSVTHRRQTSVLDYSLVSPRSWLYPFVGSISSVSTAVCTTSLHNALPPICISSLLFHHEDQRQHTLRLLHQSFNNGHNVSDLYFLSFLTLLREHTFHLTMCQFIFSRHLNTPNCTTIIQPHFLQSSVLLCPHFTLK